MKLRQFLIVALWPVFSVAQTSEIKQIASVPVQINPAFAGLSHGDIHGTINYRNFTPGNGTPLYQTVNTGIDMSLLKGKLSQGDAIGIGILYQYNEVAGIRLKSSPALSAAYHKAIGKKNTHRISFGGQASYTDHSSIETSSTKATKPYTGVSAGILYSGLLAQKIKVFAGYTYTDFYPNALNRKNVDKLTTAPLQLMCGGVAWHASKRLSVFGNARYFNMQPFSTLSYSAYSRALITPPQKSEMIAIWAGAIVTDHVVSPYIGIEAGSFRLSGSFDIKNTTPSITPVEISLLYTTKFRRTKDWNTQALF